MTGDGDPGNSTAASWGGTKRIADLRAMAAAIDAEEALLRSGGSAISGQPCVVAANDATVKAGAMFPQSVKKLIRVQKLAHRLRLPVIYLVDSAGVFLPLQDEIFPDEDDFGRIFRNNSVLSTEGVPQIATGIAECDLHLPGPPAAIR
jgi:acetyl-CoA carboxylase carboxyltransferase component